MEPLTFDSDDVGEVEHLVSAMYARMRIGGIGERTHTHITRRVMTPEVAFDDLEYTFDVEFDAEPQRYLILCHVVSGVVHLTSEGRTETFGPGDLFLSRPDLPSAGVVQAARLRQLTLDPVALTQVASSVAGEAAPARVLGRRPVSRQAALQLQRSVGYVRDSVLDAPDSPAAPLLASAASQYLAVMMLHAFPNTAITAPTAGDSRDASPETLRRALSFIDAHPDADLTIADVARAAYVTPRALQLAFRRHLDTTPLGYLRRVRLAHAREDLLAATAGDGNTVTVIAGRWGFPSPSRFAEEYRAAYGELPSRTLRT